MVLEVLGGIKPPLPLYQSDVLSLYYKTVALEGIEPSFLTYEASDLPLIYNAEAPTGLEPATNSLEN